MVEEVYKNIYRIGVVLPGNPMKELNSYLIRGNGTDLLIDTGFRRKECREALEEGLRELGSEKKRRRVLVTHIHADHSGMADLFAGEGQPIYMSGEDLRRLKRFFQGHTIRFRNTRYVAEGFPKELLDLDEKSNPSITEMMPEPDPRLTAVYDGDRIEAGDYTLETVFVPGHTPGNCMFWVEKEGIMFTGDHVLFDITPNITCWQDMEDALGDYLRNLERADAYPVKLALPGHRKTGDYHARIASLIAHHRRRLGEAEEIIRREPGLTAYDITGRMKWKIRAAGWEDFPLTQKWFAVGECLSHLDYLKERGKIQAVTREDGRIGYIVQNAATEGESA